VSSGKPSNPRSTELDAFIFIAATSFATGEDAELAASSITPSHSHAHKVDPTKYNPVMAEALRNLITGAVVGEVENGHGSVSAIIFGEDGIYRFFGSEPWGIQTPYKFLKERVCLPEITPVTCFRIFVSTGGKYMWEVSGAGLP